MAARRLRWILCVAALAVLSLIALQATSVNASQDKNWQIDPVHSSVIFKVRHLQHSNFYGRFNQIAGQVTTGANPAFAFTVPVVSIDTNSQERDNHLKSPDFFNAKQFPVITFKSTAVTVDGDTYQVIGDLTLHGETKSITVQVTKIGEGTDPWGKSRIGFNTEFTLQRSDFGMTNMLEAVGDEVTLMISFEAIAS